MSCATANNLPCAQCHLLFLLQISQTSHSPACTLLHPHPPAPSTPAPLLPAKQSSHPLSQQQQPWPLRPHCTAQQCERYYRHTTTSCTTASPNTHLYQLPMRTLLLSPTRVINSFSSVIPRLDSMRITALQAHTTQIGVTTTATAAGRHKQAGDILTTC